MDCVQEHQEDIMKCVDKSVPELFDKTREHSNIHLMIFCHENCRYELEPESIDKASWNFNGRLCHFRKGEAIRVCVEKSLLKCKDPTPSNVVNSLLLSMQNATPCKGLSASYTAGTAAASASISLLTLVSLMILVPTQLQVLF